MNLGPEHWRSKFSDFLQRHHRSFLSVYANIPRRIGKSGLWEYSGKFKTFASLFLESQGFLLPSSPFLLSLAMLSLLRLYLLLAALSTLVVSECGPWSAQPNVYADCSGDDPVPLPHSTDSTPFFKPQIRVNPLDINNNGSGWEEWMLLGHHVLEDGSQLIYSCKWALGEPTSANISHSAFIGLVYIPNGTFFREIVHDVFRYKEYEDGGFTYSVANNHLTWDPTNRLWKASVNSSGLTIESSTIM